MASPGAGGMEALHRLKSVAPPLWISPSSELSATARAASQYVFSSLKPFTPKSPFDQLLVDGFDAEQIWQQIDLQSQPLISSLRRELKRFERSPGEISKLFEDVITRNVCGKDLARANEGSEKETLGFEDLDEDIGGFDEEDEEGGETEDEESEEREDEEENEDKGKKEEEEGGGGGIEDKFLKIKDLEEYLVEDENREYGLKDKKGGGKALNKSKQEDEEEEEDDDEEDDELGVFGNEEDGPDELENARYEDFFGAKKKRVPMKKPKVIDGSEDSDTGDEQEDDKALNNKTNGVLSAHEKQLQKLRSEIEQMEKANLEPKTWTMQGEITASKRPKNSALEADLDFEHNVRPAPVITEEVTASIEELIQKRIIEGNFDDVQKAPSLPSKSPKVFKEVDENKSKKGLAEIYEEEYVQKTSLASAPLAFSDVQKKEATMLFKKLCLKLDALSHFHFAPKPVIDDMTIQVNVPALAMEEIAPVAVSDAAMLAPEEVFAGKGDIKDEAELTQAERKRRRAKKKRKFKAVSAKKMAKKARNDTLLNHNDGQGES